jgi:cytochrome P450 family 135
VQGALWNWRYVDFTTRAHERYGPTFTARIGGLPTSVVTVDRDAIKRLYTGNPLTKRHGNDLLRPALGDGSVMLLEPPEHLQRRKLLLPPFHGERVKAYARLMEELVEAELDRWRPGETVKVLPFAQDLTLEVILRAVLGVPDEGMRARLRKLYDAIQGAPAAAIGFYFPKLTGKWNPLAGWIWSQVDKLNALVAAQVTATRADPNLAEREDILAMLVQAHDEDGNGLSDEDLLSELNTLLAAGHETTAGAIAWGAEMLAHNPDVARRAREAVADGEDDYLDALVKEILRIRPPVPIAGARHAMEPFELSGHTIDPAITIIINAWGIHHDPAIYPEPGRFRPERFLQDGTPEYAFLPFGGGAHRCLGASLAQLEIRIVLSAILRRFDLEPTQDEVSGIARRATTIVPKTGARVRVAAPRATPVAAPA